MSDLIIVGYDLKIFSTDRFSYLKYYYFFGEITFELNKLSHYEEKLKF